MAAPPRRAFHALLGAVLMSSALGVSPAYAQNQAPSQVQAPGSLPPRPDPRTVPRPAQTRIKVTKLKIEGATLLGAGRVTSVLGTRSSSWIPWGRKRYFDRAVFDADLQRIEAYYADRGFPDAQVTAFDAKLNDQQDAIAITISVNEGEPVRVERIDFKGFESLRPGALRALRRNLPLQPGAILDRAQLTAAQAMVARSLQDRGYPFAQATAEEIPVEGKLVALNFNAAPGAEANYGSVVVTGNRSVGEDVILRTLAFEPGDRFSLATVQLSQRRLYDLGLFQLATVAVKSEQVSDGVVPVEVTLAEAKHRQIKLSGGYGSEERLRGEAQWKHVNFFGGARTGSVEGKWSSLDRGLRGQFTQPYLFSPRLKLTLSGQAWFTDEPAFQLDTRGGRSTLTYELTHRNAVSGRGGDSTLSASFIGEAEDYVVTTAALDDPTFRDDLIALGLDPRTGADKGFLGAIAIDYRRTTTANLLDARRGYTVQVHAEKGGGFLPGDYNYKEYTVEARHYQTLGRLGVLANRGRIGTIDGAGSEEGEPGTAPLGPRGVPFFKRYFLGGSNSLRGWGRFEVSDLSASGLPLGGHSLLEMSSELRAPLPFFDKLSIVLFIDAGSVTTAAWDIALKDLRYDAGPGLRYVTPIGPIRVDFARQLNPIPGLLVDGKQETRHWRVHFSLGQAF